MSWVDALPEVLTWRKEPDLIVGDIVVFRWETVTIDEQASKLAEKIEREEGTTTTGPTSRRVPAEYLEVKHVGRHKRGHWFATFVVRGTEKPVFLAPAAGTVSDPRRSIDSEATVMELPTDSAQQRRAMDRRELLRKLEQERQVRAAMERKVGKERNPISARLLPAMMEGADKRIAVLEKQLEAAEDSVAA